MRIISTVLLISLIFIPTPILALSNKNYDIYMQRKDFKEADDDMNITWKKVKAATSTEQFKSILANQRLWVKNGREKEVSYLKNNFPFYDTCRLYSISTRARSLYLDQILKYVKDNPSLDKTSLTNFMKNVNYVGLLNYLAPKMEEIYGITNNNYTLLVHCTYQNDTSLGEIAGIASDVLSYFTSSKAQVASIASSLMTNMSTHNFQCNFRPNVYKYSIAYFYSGLTKKFIEKETHDLKDKRVIKFSKTTGKSTLDFITIRADTIENGETIKTLYTFKVDPQNNKINAIDSQSFLSDIVHQYKQK